jgi:uncharacterized protein YfaA (DUF2138 family)
MLEIQKPSGFDNMTINEQMEYIASLPPADRINALEWTTPERFDEIVSYAVTNTDELNNPQRMVISRVLSQLPVDLKKQMIISMGSKILESDFSIIGEIADSIEIADPAIENIAVSDQEMQVLQGALESLLEAYPGLE